MYKNWSLTEVFSFREFIRSFIRFSFLEGGGLQTQEGSPLNAFATLKANTQIFTCMASLIGNKVTVMLRGFFHNCWGFFPVGLSDVQWGVHTVWSNVSQGIKKYHPLIWILLEWGEVSIARELSHIQWTCKFPTFINPLVGDQTWAWTEGFQKIQGICKVSHWSDWYGSVKTALWSNHFSSSYNCRFSGPQ